MEDTKNIEEEKSVGVNNCIILVCKREEGGTLVVLGKRDELYENGP